MFVSKCCSTSKSLSENARNVQIAKLFKNKNRSNVILNFDSTKKCIRENQFFSGQNGFSGRTSISYCTLIKVVQKRRLLLFSGNNQFIKMTSLYDRYNVSICKIRPKF